MIWICFVFSGSLTYNPPYPQARFSRRAKHLLTTVIQDSLSAFNVSLAPQRRSFPFYEGFSRRTLRCPSEGSRNPPCLHPCKPHVTVPSWLNFFQPPPSGDCFMCLSDFSRATGHPTPSPASLTSTISLLCFLRCVYEFREDSQPESTLLVGSRYSEHTSPHSRHRLGTRPLAFFFFPRTSPEGSQGRRTVLPTSLTHCPFDVLL